MGRRPSAGSHAPGWGLWTAVYSWSRCSVDVPTPPTGGARARLGSRPTKRRGTGPRAAHHRLDGRPTRAQTSRADAHRRTRCDRRPPPLQLVVADRAQVHSHNGQRLQSKTYGYYRCTFADGAVKTARIRIYHRTAVRQQVITTKVFLNTLLHEWEHHHDFGGLRLPRSPHTAGFYARLRALAGALEVAFVMPPEPGADSTAQTSAA